MPLILDMKLWKNLNKFNLLYRAVFKSTPPERNEHFLPGRMAYLIELEDEMAESDIPTTVLRSKVDCPGTLTQFQRYTNESI